MVSSFSEGTATEVMFHASGARPGPSFGVVGPREDLERVIARIEALPPSAYLRGTIAFYADTGPVPQCESVLMLRDVPCGAEVATAPSTAFYRAILQRAAALGVLAGGAAAERPLRKARWRFRLGQLTPNAALGVGHDWAGCR